LNPTDAWLAEREQVPGVAKLTSIENWTSPAGAYFGWAPCNPDAFATAARALRSRRTQKEPFAAYDAAALRAWVDAQDRVFGYCGSEAKHVAPEPLPASAPPVLRADRDYQIAAARFYAGDYDDARQRFERIARDAASPWRDWGDYLAARALLRKALGSPNGATLTEAKRRLDAIIDAPDHDGRRMRALRLMGFVRFHLEPGADRALSLARRLAHLEDEFGQDAIDLSLLATSWDPLRDKSELIDWVYHMSADASPAADTAADPQLAERQRTRSLEAVTRYRRKKSLPWLVAALIRSAPSDPAVAELLAAADAVGPESPAYDTVVYHASRLRLSHKDAAERARAIAQLDQAIARYRDDPYWPAHNLLRALRFQTARNFDELVELAVRYRVGRAFDQEGRQIPDDALGGRAAFWDYERAVPAPSRGPAFDGDGAELLTHLPLSRWVALADHPHLPAALRPLVLRAAWVRALLLGDQATAEKLAPRIAAALPTAKADVPLWKTSWDTIAAASSGEARRFAMLLALLRLPGARPYVDAGFERVEALSGIDNFRDNWWCGAGAGWTSLHVGGDAIKYVEAHPALSTPSLPAFLDAAERRAASSEWQALQKAGPGVAWLVEAVVRHVTAHPDAPSAAEALWLANRATHYGACLDARTSRASKAAWILQHKLFPDDPRTRKTRYWW
jgi:hypothetical protein